MIRKLNEWLRWLLESDSPKAKVLRTWAQGLAYDVGLAVVAAVTAAVQSGSVDVTTRAGLVALVVLVGKTAFMAALSWFMARFKSGARHAAG